MEKYSEKEVLELAKAAYVFGYPLVLMDQTRQIATNVEQPDFGHAPINQFAHLNRLPTPGFTDVVRPNRDTLYSSAFLDLEQEPIVLSVPDMKGRYFMVPLLDAYTNVFSVPGTRTGVKNSQNFLIAGPHWQGKVPQGTTLIQAPTNMVWIITRIQVSNEDDAVSNVVPLQKALKLTPLSKFGTEAVPSKGKVNPSITKEAPVKKVQQMDIKKFFNEVNRLMVANPPSSADAPLLEKIANLGVGAGKEFKLSKFESSIQKELSSLPEKLIGSMYEATKKLNLVNGWSLALDIGSYGTNYLVRAIVALIGLGANLPQDAIYPNGVLDADGAPLDGANNYVVHFEAGKTPPANAFWSLTMYKDDFLVENPIKRYTIGDRSNLLFNSDGSLDIYVQHQSPGAGKESNWLPSPRARFNLQMRIYYPKKEVLDKSWIPPPIQKTN